MTTVIDGTAGITTNNSVYTDASGNTGIGTTSPTVSLQVYNATNATLQVDGDVSAVIRTSRYSTDTTAGTIQTRKSRGTFASPTTVASGDSAGNLLLSAYGGSNYRPIGLITAIVETYTSDTNISGYLTFQTNSGSTATTERMRIDAAGNVGIGATANASAILDAQSTTKGVRMPNMTTVQKNAISSPAAGLMVFDTTLSKLCVYTGAAWQTITSV